MSTARASTSPPGLQQRGETFVTREETLDGERVTRFFAVYEMLEGLDKYTWVKNRCTDKEYDSAGRVLAQFHYFAHDFDPRAWAASSRRSCISCATAPSLRGATPSRPGPGQLVDEYFLARLPAIVEALRKGAEQEPELQGMPYIPVHCDYHPGNHKWVDAEAADSRPVETTGSCARACSTSTGPSSTTASSTWPRLVYFCSSWEGRDSGELWLDKAALFVRAYQDEAARFDEPGPMSAAELAALPRMIANANLYVLNWDVTAYYEADEAGTTTSTSCT